MSFFFIKSIHFAQNSSSEMNNWPAERLPFRFIYSFSLGHNARCKRKKSNEKVNNSYLRCCINIKGESSFTLQLCVSVRMLVRRSAVLAPTHKPLLCVALFSFSSVFVVCLFVLFVVSSELPLWRPRSLFHFNFYCFSVMCPLVRSHASSLTFLWSPIFTIDSVSYWKWHIVAAAVVVLRSFYK